MKLTTGQASRIPEFRRPVERDLIRTPHRRGQEPRQASQGFLRRFHRRTCKTGLACRELAGKGMRCARSVEGVDLYNDGAWRRVARSRERPCLAVQAYCKNLPSDHGQLAGISKLNPRRRGDSFFYKPQMRRGLASAQLRRAHAGTRCPSRARGDKNSPHEFKPFGNFRGANLINWLSFP
jgi:hypothetical protein